MLNTFSKLSLVVHTEATGYSWWMWVNKITCDGRHLTLPSQSPFSLLQPSLSYPPLPLSPPTHPNSATYPPQTHSLYCCKERLHIYMAVLGGIYFDRIIMFEMLKQKGQVYIHYVDLSGVYASMLCMSLALNRSSALQHFECNDTIKMCNGNDGTDR